MDEAEPTVARATEAHSAAAERGAAGGAAPSGRTTGRPASVAGIYLFGVVRSAGRRGAQLVRGVGAEFLQVRYRELVALARPSPFDVPALERAELIAHQRAVEHVMRRGTILPAPPGVVFRGRRPLMHFLEDQYLALEEGLGFLEGSWELRLHIAPAAPGPADGELVRLAAQLYAELRRLARAAVPFPREERRLLSAAFLVERAGWIDFVERAEDLGASHGALALDVTGPWPPYDFVKLVF